MALLEVRSLNAGYGEVQILWDVGLSLEAGRITCLVGANGAGKTTLLRAVMGLIRPRGGSVRLEGREISRLAAYRKADLGLVLVPEGRQLFADMTVYENLEMGASNRRARGLMTRNLARVYELFPRIQERRGQRAGTLSGGEQQMLAIARGLMAEPSVLMIDELSLGLAPSLVLSLFESLRKIQSEGLTVLLVEQNVHLALSVSHHAYVLSEGRVVLSGPAEDVAGNEEVRRSYLGM